MVSYCPICGKPVYFGEKKRSLGRDYHPLCLKCHKCKRQLTPGQHYTSCYRKKINVNVLLDINVSNMQK
uniref:Zgc:195282 n=1 Tax=Astyanax mexicanus TaxID=7994 RepID=A0A8B9KZU8_ASTMX